MGAIKEVLVPDIGDFKDIPVIEVMVKPGDTVKAEDSLIVLESDKATLDVPAPFGGAVRNLKVRVGDRVSEGTAILELEAAEVDGETAAVGEPAAPEPPPQAPAVVSQPFAPIAAVESGAAPTPSLAHASPSIRRFARELGVDLGKVSGTGPKHRILKEDVQSFVKGALVQSAPVPVSGGGAARAPGIHGPKVDFAKFGPIERQSLSRDAQGANLQRNWTTIPHLAHFDEADITELESFRQEIAAAGAGPDLEVTLLALLMKAAVTALEQFPALNASLDGDDLVLKRYYHLGFTVDTQYGPVVPAIKDVDRKGILELAKELGDLSVRARDKRLEPADIQGGTFTISSLGAIGGTGFTPIINSPEVATLGVTRSKPRLVEKDGQVVTRIMLPLSLSYDPRVIDGVAAARFTDCLATVLGDLRRATL